MTWMQTRSGKKFSFTWPAISLTLFMSACGPSTPQIISLTEACTKSGGHSVFTSTPGISGFVCREKKVEEK